METEITTRCIYCGVILVATTYPDDDGLTEFHCEECGEYFVMELIGWEEDGQD